MVKPPKRAPARHPRRSACARRGRGRAAARARAGALPPPSPCSTTSWASSSSSPCRSPSCGGGEEAGRELVALLARGLEARAPLLDVAAGPRRELAGVVLARADDLGDPARRGSRTPRAAGTPRAARARGSRAARGRRATASRPSRPGAAGSSSALGDERLRQPLAHVGLAADPRRAQLVDRQPRDHRREVGARRLDPLAALARPVEAQERLLHHVLGLAHAAEHPVGDRERRRPQLVEAPRRSSLSRAPARSPAASSRTAAASRARAWPSRSRLPAPRSS